MKVLLVNGSSRQRGCTGVALAEVERALREEGVQTETLFLGNAPIADCMACGQCRKLGKCVLEDAVNPFVEKAREARLRLRFAGVLRPSLGQNPVLPGPGIFLRQRRLCLQARRRRAQRPPGGYRRVLRRAQ